MVLRQLRPTASHNPSSLSQGLNLLLHWPYFVKNVINFWCLMCIWNRSGIPGFASYLGCLPWVLKHSFYFSSATNPQLSWWVFGLGKVNFCWYLSQQRAFDTIGLESSAEWKPNFNTPAKQNTAHHPSLGWLSWCVNFPGEQRMLSSAAPARIFVLG